MKQAYVDANVILRFITGDPPEMADRAARLLAQVDDGSLELVVEPIVIAEVVWVLSSFYGFPATQTARVLRTFLVCKGIICDHKAELLEALALYEEKRIDFADALLGVLMMRRGVTDVYSFDKHFDRLGSVRRLSPE